MNTFKISKAFKVLDSVDKRFIIVYGGAGSGKSYTLSQKVILSCISEPGIVWCVARKVAGTLKHSVFTELRARIREHGLDEYFTINKSDYTIECVNGSRIIMIGIDDPEKLKSIAGIRRFWLEEASELTQNDFIQINLRLRGHSRWPKHIYLTFNPIHTNHWLKAEFFDRVRNDTFILKSTYLDNAFSDDAYKAQLEAFRETSPYHYEVYALGNWGNLEGQIYTNYDVIPGLPDTYDDRFYGLDFGYNNPSALIEVRVKDLEYYIRELIYASHLTNSDLIDWIRQLEIKGYIYCDSAEPDRIRELQNAGFLATESDKAVRPGIDYVKAKTLHITEDSVFTLKEITGYQWQKTRDDRVIDEPIKVNDHSMAAIRYAIFTHNKGHIEVPVIRASGVQYPKESPGKSIPDLITQMRMNAQIRKFQR